MTGTADPIERAKLALGGAKALVLRVSRVRHDRTLGTIFESIVLPLGKFPGLSHRESLPDIAALVERFGLQIERVSERIRLVEAPGYVAQHLGIHTGTHVVELDRVTHIGDGEAIEWRVAYAWKHHTPPGAVRCPTSRTH
jgi:DNA-binding GntR family transcriptional regulator